MKLLLLSTAGPTGFVALADSAGIVAEAALPGRGASEALLSALRHVLDEARLQPGQLTHIAAVHGPGSFTGVRIGLAAAKGLAEAHALPLLAMSRLELIAGPHPTALLDAGRGQLYRRRGSGVAACEDLVTPPIDLAGAVTADRAVSESLGIPLVPDVTPHAMHVLALAAIAQGRFTDIALADAHYLRRLDIES